jgi:hypothetical protein
MTSDELQEASPQQRDTQQQQHRHPERGAELIRHLFVGSGKNFWREIFAGARASAS